MPKYRKYLEINRNLLINPNSSMSVYWLGFIAADGAIVRNSLNIQLAAKDLDHVQKFKQHMLLDNPIRKRNTTCGTQSYKSYSISVYSKKLIHELRKYNLVQNKSKTLSFPRQLENNKYVNSFIRGYVDGDGGFYRHGHGIKIYLTGTYDFLDRVRHIIVQRCKLPDQFMNKKIKSDGSVYALEFADRNICKQILNWLYLGSINDELFLSRKYNQIKDLLDFEFTDLTCYQPAVPIGSTSKKNLDKETLKRLYTDLGTITAIANYLDVDNRTVTKYMKKHSIPYRKIVPKKRTDKVNRKELERAIKYTNSIRELSRIFSCSRGLITSRLKEYNLQIKV